MDVQSPGSGTGSDRSLPWRTLVLLSFVYFLSASGRVANSDAGSMLELSRSLLHGQISIPQTVAHTIGVDGRPYCHMGLLPSLWWTPFLVLGRGFSSLIPSIPIEYWEEFFVSFSGGLIMVILLGYLALEWQRKGLEPSQVRRGLLLIGLGTLIWPYAKLTMSDSLMALTLFAAYYHWQNSGKNWHAITAGIWLGLSLLSRKQAQAILPVFFLFFCWKPVLPKLLWRLVLLGLGFLPALLVQMAYNQARWGSPIREKYAGYESWQFPSLVEWISRSYKLLFGGDYSGLLYFSPVLLVMLLAAWLKWWRSDRPVFGFVIILCISQVLFITEFPYWEALGGTFGSRFLLFLIPFIALSWCYWPAKPSVGWRAALILAFGIGMAIQILGVTTDPLATYWRREMYLPKNSWIIRAHFSELKRALAIDRTPPPADSPFAELYWKHPTFQEPDLWWCHLLKQLKRLKTRSNAEQH